MYKKKSKFILEKKIEEIFNELLSHIIQTLENEICICSFGEGADCEIKFFDINTNKEIAKISDIMGNSTISKNLKMINENILAITGYCNEGIFLINVKEHSLITKITSNFAVYCILNLKNEKFLTFEENEEGFNHIKIWNVQDEKWEIENDITIKPFESSFKSASIAVDDTIIIGNDDGILEFYKENK